MPAKDSGDGSCFCQLVQVASFAVYVTCIFRLWLGAQVCCVASAANICGSVGRCV